MTPRRPAPLTTLTAVFLGEHALRYMDENPIAAMRLSDPGQTRIHTVGYELTDEERTKAGNNDYQIRGTIGLICGV